jgi:hypothetical protein
MSGAFERPARSLSMGKGMAFTIPKRILHLRLLKRKMTGL